MKKNKFLLVSIAAAAFSILSPELGRAADSGTKEIKLNGENSTIELRIEQSKYGPNLTIKVSPETNKKATKNKVLKGKKAENKSLRKNNLQKNVLSSGKVDNDKKMKEILSRVLEEEKQKEKRAVPPTVDFDQLKSMRASNPIKSKAEEKRTEALSNQLKQQKMQAGKLDKAAGSKVSEKNAEKPSKLATSKTQAKVPQAITQKADKKVDPRQDERSQPVTSKNVVSKEKIVVENSVPQKKVDNSSMQAKTRKQTVAAKGQVSTTKQNGSFGLEFSAGGIGNVKNGSIELEYKRGLLAFGVNYNKLSLVNSDNVKLDGAMFTVNGHYSLIPVSQDNRYSLRLMAGIGAASFTSSAQEGLPTYLAGQIGLENLYYVSGSLALYNRISSLNIYHQDSSVLNLGNEISIGLRVRF